jgi:hypothetical protein
VRSAHRQRPRRRHHPDQGGTGAHLRLPHQWLCASRRTGVEVAVPSLAAEFLPGKHRMVTEPLGHQPDPLPGAAALHVPGAGAIGRPRPRSVKAGAAQADGAAPRCSPPAAPAQSGNVISSTEHGVSS